jgi:predicted PurR-regulated permease PerM
MLEIMNKLLYREFYTTKNYNRSGQTDLLHKERKMVIDVGYWTRVLKRILILAISLLVIYLSFKLAIFYMPFLIALIISLMVEPLIKKIVNKTHITRKRVAVCVIVVIFLIIFGLIAWGIFSLITESSNLMQKLNYYIEIGTEKISDYIDKIRSRETSIPEQVITLVENSSDKIIVNVSNFAYEMLTKVTHIISSLPVFAIYAFITILSTYFICTDRMYILDQMEHHLPSIWVKKIGIHFRSIIKSLGCYLKAEIILVIISFFIVLVGLYILKFTGHNVPYPLLTSIGIGLVDALPILRLRDSNGAMGYSCCYKWRFTTWNIYNNYTSYNNGSKTIIGT